MSTEKPTIENRKQRRFSSEDTIFIELEEQLLEEKSQSFIVICQVLDVSSSGLRVEIDRPVIQGSYLRICVQLSDAEVALVLMGEVKWVKQLDEHSWQVGFALLDSADTDLEAWQLLTQGL